MDSEQYKKALDELHRQILRAKDADPTTLLTSTPRQTGKNILLEHFYEQLREKHGLPLRGMIMMAQSNIGDLVTPETFTNIWVDELADIDMTKIDWNGMVKKADKMAKTESLSAEARARLKALAEKITARAGVGDLDTCVTLLGPATLTVDTPGKGYRKVPHIGGDEFRLVGAYVGSEKANSKLIFVFRPTAVVGYAEMEMDADTAQTHLRNFRPAVNLSCNGDFFRELRAITEVETKAREEEAVREKFNDYEEFGSW